MSEQIKADFVKAQKHVKAGQYDKAISILKPHKAHPRIAALITDLEIKRKSSSGGILRIVIWILIIVIVGAITGSAGYIIGDRTARSHYEIPQSMEEAFVDICTANLNLTTGECSRAVRASWQLHQEDALACFQLSESMPDLTAGQFLQCFADLAD